MTAGRGDALRVAYLAYRGNPHSGGQGVYTRYLTAELVNLGHTVEVFGGQPYPVLEPGVGFTPVPSLGSLLRGITIPGHGRLEHAAIMRSTRTYYGVSRR